MKLYKNLPTTYCFDGNKRVPVVILKDSSPETPDEGLLKVAKIGKRGIGRKYWIVFKFDMTIRGKADGFTNDCNPVMIYNNDQTIGVDSNSLNKLNSIIGG